MKKHINKSHKIMNTGYIAQLGLPYMGGKRKLAKKLVDEILNANPKTKYIYDLFGGGAAISLEAIQRKKIKKVVYNELNTGVTELLKKIKLDGVTKEFYEFIDRETFKKHKDDDCWYGGLCKIIWSFGNNQKDYLYGKEIEESKRIAYNALVFKDEEELKALSDILGIELPTEILNMSTTKGRQQLGRIVEKCGKAEFRLQHMERLVGIKHIERLVRVAQLEILNKNYLDVKITTPIEKTIIYLDPPYEGTAEYQEGDFCHRRLEKYIADSPHKIYVSSYNFNLPLVASFEHTSSFSATKTNKVTENLYCNREHKDLTRLF